MPVVCSVSTENVPTAVDIMPIEERAYPVGRRGKVVIIV